LDSDGIEEAVAALNYSTGGTQNWDYLYFYRMETGSRGYGGLVRTFVQDQLLVVDFADPGGTWVTAVRKATFTFVIAGRKESLQRKEPQNVAI
jgi:hypothetical protein